jgi:hypothetical protein
MRNTETKNWNNFFLGLVVAVFPFVGVPLLFKQIVLLVLGLLIALFSLARLGRSSSPDLPLTPHEPLA